MKRKILFWLIPVVLVALAASIPLYRSYVEAAPDSVDVSDEVQEPQLMLSHASGSSREHEIKALQAELQKNPDHLPILLRLAQTSRESGKLNDSVGYLRDAVAQDPKNVDANLELGRALFETGDTNGAIRATEHVLEINPSHVDALYNLGAIYGNMSQDDRARQYWEKTVSLSPDSESGRRAKENLTKLR